MVRVLSAVKLSSCREAAQISGVQTCLLAEDDGPKQGLSQKLCRFYSPYSHFCRLVSEESRNQDGSPRCSSKALPGRADTSPLAGCLEHKMGPQKLSSRDLGGVCQLHAQGAPVLALTGRGKSFFKIGLNKLPKTKSS